MQRISSAASRAPRSLALASPLVDFLISSVGERTYRSDDGRRRRPSAGDAIESFNYQIWKIIKNRGQFPTDDAVVKLVWLAIVDIEDKRARAREKERANERTAPRRLIEGHATQGWKQTINALSIVFEDRIPEHAL